MRSCILFAAITCLSFMVGCTRSEKAPPKGAPDNGGQTKNDPLPEGDPKEWPNMRLLSAARQKDVVIRHYQEIELGFKRQLSPEELGPLLKVAYVVAVTSLAWSADGKWLVAAGDIGSPKGAGRHLYATLLRGWNATTREEIHFSVGDFKYPVETIGFAPDSKRFLTARSRHVSLTIWDVDPFKKKAEILQDANRPAFFHANGKWIFGVSGGGGLQVYDAATGKLSTDPLFVEQGYPDQGINVSPRLSGFGVLDMAASAAYPFTAISYGDALHLADVLARESFQLSDHRKENHRCYDLTFSPDGKRLAASVWPASGPLETPKAPYVRIWSTESRKQVFDIKLAESGGKEKCALAYSPNGKWLATGRDTQVRLYDAATGKEGPAFTARGEISALVFRPDSKRVASGDSDGMIMSWAVPD